VQILYKRIQHNQSRIELGRADTNQQRYQRCWHICVGSVLQQCRLIFCMALWRNW